MAIGIMEAVRDPRLRVIVYKYMNENYQGESFAFLFDKKSNKDAYERYIREGAPKEVNIPGRMRKLLDEQAKRGQWGAMNANMEAARDAIESMINKDVMPRFEASDEYKGYVASLDDSPGAKVARALKLKPQSTDLLKGLLKVFNDARTPVDKYKAYEAMIKLAGNESKLSAGLRAGGVTPLPPMRKGSPDAALKSYQREEWYKELKVRATVINLLKKYNSASTRSAREVVRGELIKLMSKHSLNGRETTDRMLFSGGWTSK